jgi:hypothetical protein
MHKEINSPQSHSIVFVDRLVREFHVFAVTPVCMDACPVVIRGGA